jgi:leucyl aminopeptidase
MMDVRALNYSSDLVGDLLLLVAEDTLGQFEWPNAIIKTLIVEQGFSGKFGETAFCTYFEEGTEKPRKVIVGGLGKTSELCLEKVRKACGKALKEAEKRKVETLSMVPWTFDALPVADVARAVTEVALLSSYRFDRYLSEKKESSLKSFQIC